VSETVLCPSGSKPETSLTLDDEPSITLSYQDSPVLTNPHNGLLVTHFGGPRRRLPIRPTQALAAAGITDAELERLGIANLSAFLVKGRSCSSIRKHICGDL
jgi:hypothetical protein